MDLEFRWYVKLDGTRVLQYRQPSSFSFGQRWEHDWDDVPEVFQKAAKQPVKKPK